jgi:putative ABC transport system permease protein
MFQNFIKVAIRNLLKQKSFTFINVIGLAIGMTCFVLIFLFVRFEFSYDKAHEKADQIYRVAMERKYPDKVRLWGRTAFPIARTFPEEYLEILQGTRLMAPNITIVITYGEKNIQENRVMFADPNIFEVFTIPLIQGVPDTALAQQNSAVITEETAQKFFGQEDAMGKMITVGNAAYMITGVAESMPENSHFHFDFLLSLITIPVYNGQEWINNWGAFTYFLLQDGCDVQALEARFADMVRKYMAPEIEDEVKTSFDDFVASGNGYRYFLQPLKDIHLKSHLDQEIEANGNITYVYLFSVISVFVLLIACINFMNLATARSTNRAKEVGVRKTLGSARKQLIAQFLLESTLLSGLAFVITLFLVWLFLPVFNNISGQQLAVDYFGDTLILPGLIGLTLLVGFLAGSYPAFFLSSFQPVTVLKRERSRGSANSLFRNGLVIFQFTISIILIIGTLVVNRQIRYMLSKDLGFDKEQVIVIKDAYLLNQQVKAFKQELMTNANVISVSGSFNFPGTAFDGNTHKPEGTSDDRAVSLSVMVADYDFVKTMGMEIVAGRSFSEEYATDPNAYILNETAVELLGLTDPVGSRITDNDRMYTVVGVLKDFHFKSLHHEISPVVYIGNPGDRAGFLSVRIRPENISGTLSFLEQKWGELTGGQPFSYSFLDDDLAAQYDAEQKTRQISGIFSLLAVLIGCLGLFGLAAFTAEQRTKEIGIRKILGASVSNIVILLVKDFVKLVGFAFVIGSPVAYFFMGRWLHNFAYSTDIRVDSFLLAGALALGIALLTVSYQAIRASLAEPVDSLRYE